MTPAPFVIPHHQRGVALLLVVAGLLLVNRAQHAT